MLWEENLMPEPNELIKLKELHDELIAEGCRRFYIDQVGGPQSDDVEALYAKDGSWHVSYVERGRKEAPMFSSTSLDDAIQYYRNHVRGIRHAHLILCTRSHETFATYKEVLEQHFIETWRNDIRSFNARDDLVYRLFVFGSDIFRVKELDVGFPVIDEDLQY